MSNSWRISAHWRHYFFSVSTLYRGKSHLRLVLDSSDMLKPLRCKSCIQTSLWAPVSHVCLLGITSWTSNRLLNINTCGSNFWSLYSKLVLCPALFIISVNNILSLNLLKNLEVTRDSSLFPYNQTITKSLQLYLQNTSQINPLLSFSCILTLVQTTIISPLDD